MNQSNAQYKEQRNEQYAQAQQNQMQSVENHRLIESANNFEDLQPETKKRIQSLAASLQIMEMCRALAYSICGTNLVPKAYYNMPEDAAVAMMWGNEIGLKELESLKNIAVINGVPTLWGDALVALVRSSPVCEFLYSEWDEKNQVAKVVTKRKGNPEEFRTFSIQDAQKAGLATKKGDMYLKYDQRMLHARARSFLLRDVYADVLRGFDVREVVEEDARREKDITPMGETLKSILDSVKPANDSAEASPSESDGTEQHEQTQPNTEQHNQPEAAEEVVNATPQEEPKALSYDDHNADSILKYINGCETLDQLNQVKGAIVSNFHGEEQDTLKSVYMDKGAVFLKDGNNDQGQ